MERNLFRGMKYPLLWSLFALAFGFASVTSLEADPIFINFGPGDVFVNGNYWTLSHDHPIHHVDEDCAFPFIVSDDYLPGSMSLSAGIYFGSNEFDVWLLNNAGNMPESVLEHFHFAGTMSSHRSAIAGTSELQTLLNAGDQYCLCACVSDPTDTQANCCFNPIVDMGLITGRGDTDSLFTFPNAWGHFTYPSP